MANELENLREKYQRTGVFDGYMISGWRFGNDAGRDAWRILLGAPGHSPEHDYWLEGGNLSVANTKYDNNYVMRIEKSKSDIEPKKRAAIFHAIAEWEQVGEP